jgi:hypothetical protein
MMGMGLASCAAGRTRLRTSGCRARRMHTAGVLLRRGRTLGRRVWRCPVLLVGQVRHQRGRGWAAAGSGRGQRAPRAAALAGAWPRLPAEGTPSLRTSFRKMSSLEVCRSSSSLRPCTASSCSAAAGRVRARSVSQAGPRPPCLMHYHAPAAGRAARCEARRAGPCAHPDSEQKWAGRVAAGRARGSPAELRPPGGSGDVLAPGPFDPGRAASGAACAPFGPARGPPLASSRTASSVCAPFVAAEAAGGG